MHTIELLFVIILATLSSSAKMTWTVFWFWWCARCGCVFLAKASGGNFPTKGGPLDGIWARALKADEDLRQRYTAVGKSFNAQKEFRVKWATEEWRCLVRRSSYVESSEDTHHMAGRPMNLAQIAWELKSKWGAANYLAEALRRHSRGDTFEGEPWVSYKWTRMLSIVYVETTISSSISKRWEVVEESQGNSQVELGTPQKVALQNVTPEATAQMGGAMSAEGCENGVGEPRKLDRAGQNGKTPRKPPSNVVPDPAKKDLDSKFIKLRHLKSRTTAAQSLYGETVSTIQGRSEWAWACHELGELEKLKTALDAAKAQGGFWDITSHPKVTPNTEAGHP